MSKYLLVVLLLLGITAKANAQEMMLNGSFEECDGNPDGDTVLSTVNYAAYWQTLIGSSDLVHPCVPVSMSGDPCFGVGCGRFGLNANGYAEYLYGQTQQLTAGQIYEVSFWIRKDYPTDALRKVGLAITETVPTASITNTTPLIQEVISSTQCVKLKACFTAQSSVTHYVTIGPFGGESSTEPILYLVDSVSVITIPPTTPLAQANLTVSEPVICHGELATLDGTSSANETSYEWNIFYPSNGGNNVYSSGIIQGQAGTITPVLPFMTPGNCFRAELKVYGVCTDVAIVEFCIANPNVDFIFDGNPVCENTPVDLQVTGDNGWVYTWTQAGDTLANGQGIQALTVTPTMGNGVYTITVTTPEGCHYSETLHINVQAQNNLAPWMDGINGTGEYTYYVSQGDAVFFNSVLSNDYSNEQLLNSGSWTIPSGFVATLPTTSSSIFSLSWVTSSMTPTGEYHYYLTSNDQNACGEGISTFDFRIIVVCDQCPICVNYEDRTPSGTRLPTETKAGKCIEAGMSQIVSTGDANVLFQAGAYILEGPYFDAGPGYEGVIDPETCVTDCEDCCADWSGFHFDALPSAFYINFTDSDPTNEFIQVTDTYHPFCAFGATGFKFEIFNRWGIQMNDQDLYSINAEFCCPFESPAPENPIPHSPIWWDGHTIELLTGDIVQANDGTYTYLLELISCNGQTYSTSGIIQIGGQDPNALILSPGETQESAAWLSPEQQELLESNKKEREQLDRTLNLFPNPTTGLVQITGLESDNIQYQVFDEKGILLSHKEKAVNNCFSLTNYSKGTYYIRIYSGTTYVVRKVVKM